MRYPFSLVIAFWPVIIKAQFQIEPLDSCIKSIVEFHSNVQLQDSIALQSFKEKKWFNLLPGIGYDPLTNRAGIHLNLTNYLNFLNRKNENQYRNYQVRKQKAAAITEDTIAIKPAYRILEIIIQGYQTENELLKNDSLILALKIEENKNLQATTEDVLKVKLSFLEKVSAHERNMIQILTQIKQVESYLHRSLKIKFPSSHQLDGKNH